MRRAAKIDNNHGEIVKALRDAGAFVQSLATIGGGCPDLLVAFRGTWFVLEIKDKNGKLTADQIDWGYRLAGRGLAVLVRSPEEALGVIGACCSG